MSTPANFKVCPTCNAALSLAATECSVCRTSFVAIPPDAGFYPRTPPPSLAPVDPNRWIVSLLLAFFIGNFGVHRFYMGYNSIGMVMLILTLVGIATSCIFVGIILIAIVRIWAFVDFVLICCNAVPLADGRRLR